MVSDGVVRVRDTSAEELDRIHEMERGEARRFVIPYSPERHEAELRKDSVSYQSICTRDGRLVGFMILALDPDGRSVELRRIVIEATGRGFGTRAVALVDELCRELDRERVWLDVFEDNERARHVYEKSGYTRAGTSEHEGRTLLVYEKELSRPAG